ncbi:ABC transporter permease subunit [Pseudoxanthobacter sp.]|uniref:ABC transporter permease subunit n=1 Tax=Pseudoxanthobacter sp. TaxID=1925742 RepID=UPI002FDF4439
MADSNPKSGKGRGRWIVTAIPFAWMLIFFLIPFLIVLRISFSQTAISMPPYTPVFNLFADPLSETWKRLGELSFDTYVFLTSDDLYWRSYINSVWIAFTSTVMLLIIGYPIAYGMACAKREWRPLLLMLVILPFWTSFLIRVYAWIGILSREGLLNKVLIWVGLVDPAHPLVILSTTTAVYIGIVYSYLPFMVLPLYSALEKMDGTLLEAAADLGCPPIKAFWTITFPLSLPGVIAGSFLVFIPTVGEFVIPDLLGGSDTLMIGRTMWNEFFNNRDWPVASAVAVVLLVILVVPIVLFQNHQAKMQERV